MNRPLVAVALALFFVPDPMFAQQRVITARYIESGIQVDGNLDEPEWSRAEVATDFIQKDPVMGVPASERSEVRVLYDDENIYIGATLFDSAGREGIVITGLSRDYIPLETDHFGVVLDTFDDDRNGFTFATNPGGAKRDGQVGQDGARNNFSWDAIWYVRTKITDEGWRAEMAIPFQSIRFREGENQVWGINFTRRIRRKNESVQWSPVSRPYGPSRVSMAGELRGIGRVGRDGGIRRGRNLYLKPYLSAPVVRREEDDVDFLPDAGLDVKYGVTTGLTLDLTVNTDFSQVEADEQQINLTRFPLFFPEKREFFLENSSLFQVKRVGRGFRSRDRDLIAFFSRRIGLAEGRVVPILGGARLTGTAGRYRLGLLSLQADELEETPSTNYTVVRVRRDVLGKSDVGGLFINKQAEAGDYNRTFGLDTNFRFWKYLDVSAFLMKTETPELDGKDLSFYSFVGWADPFYEIEAEYLSIDENFNPEVGFVPRTGIRKSRGEFNLKHRPGEGFPLFRQLTPSSGIEHIANQENELVSRDFDQTVSFEMNDGSRGWVTHRFRFERLDEPFSIREGQDIPAGDYWFRQLTASYMSDQSRMFSGQVFLRKGDFFDGQQTALETTFGFRPNYRLFTSVAWNRDDVDLPSGDFITDLARLRVNYFFSPRMFLNALVQYNSDLKEISSNIRFNFIYRPLNDFFLVYNERRTTTGEVRERALVAKLTYVFDF